MQPTDVVILSNGPGEVITWVRPVVKCLRQTMKEAGEKLRISLILSPCPHSTGKEAAIALSYPEIDRVLSPTDFWSFLLWGKTPENWQWHQQGIVVFLGGDQFYTVLISKRLKYSSLIYAEWDARWYRLIDHFAVMNQKVIEKVPQSYREKFSLVGDLMADTALGIKDRDLNPDPTQPTIGLLIGSKPAKLSQGVPLLMAIAEKVQQHLPQVKFIIPVAPTINLNTVSQYANSSYNPLVATFGNVEGHIVTLEDNHTYLVTDGGTKINLITQFPAYQSLVNCQLCLTTVGANTAELTALGIPMIVLLPTQQLDAMRSWDGLPGIMANIPGLGTIIAKLINWLILKQGRLFAWPNIWAGKEIVPELVGKLQPEAIAQVVLNYLANPNKLVQMRQQLLNVRGNTGASQKIADIIKQQISKT
ncbi:putative lipid-A-disaccharide synthase [Chondrocystis sp. NIES-4102]|nr:putative lipid-A-disaccharide synthase [Chondrocystis sp. NIES-4102]